MSKLKCRVCDFKSNDLVDHIETEHAALGGLDWYMDEFPVGKADVIHPSLSGEKREEIEVGGKTVTVQGVRLPVNKAPGPYVPSVNPTYHFAEFAQDLANDVLENKRVMLVGHTGTGKTSSVVQLAAITKNDILRVNLNGQTSIGDFVGLWTVKGGEMKWVDGLLPQAMRKGYWLIIDEIDFGEPAILGVLNSVLETDGQLTLKENDGEIVTPHKNFRIFATGNAIGCMAEYRNMYPGTNIMNDAFLDRWRVYKVDYLPPADEVKVLKGCVPKLSAKVAIRIVAVANDIRKSFEAEDVQCAFSTRRLIDWSEQMIRHRNPIKAAESTIFAKVSKEDSETIKGIIIRMMDPNAMESKGGK